VIFSLSAEVTTVGKLNQLIAVLPGKKSAAQEALTQAYHVLQKPDLFSGLTRQYQPKDEGGEPQPPERKMPQAKVNDLVARATVALTAMMDAVAAQDRANTEARADVVVGGRVLLPQVPVTTLLFLEKQLVDLKAFAEKLPTLDPAEEWEYKADFDYHASKPAQTNRTKKVPKVIEKAPATKEHPAQVELHHEDVWVGTWTTVKFSGAVPAKEKNAILERVAQLSEAVKSAREEANGIEVKPAKLGGPVLDFVFRGR